MSTTTTKMPAASEGLRAMGEQVQALKAQARQVQAERGGLKAGAEQARETLREFYADPSGDATTEKKLRAAVVAADEEFDAYEQRAAGRELAVKRAEDKRRQYIAEHFDALAAEGLAVAQRVHADVIAANAEFQRAWDAYEATTSSWTELAEVVPLPESEQVGRHWKEVHDRRVTAKRRDSIGQVRAVFEDVPLPLPAPLALQPDLDAEAA